MCKSSMGVPRLANVLLLLFIGNFSVALSTVIHDRALPRRSPNFVADPSVRDNLAHLPARWRLVSSEELQPPEIEIQLLKGHVQEDKDDLWALGTEYKYSSLNYKIETMESSDQSTSGNKLDENGGAAAKKSNGVKSEGKVPSNKSMPQIDMRNIIDVPSFECPSGQKKDPNGQCRDIIQL